MKNDKCDRRYDCDDYKYDHCEGCGGNKPQGDLISRSELKKAINDFYDEFFDGCFSTALITYAKGVDEIIENAPTVEPTQSGHWVEEKISAGTRKVFCSECGCPPPFEYVSTGDVYSASGYGVINKTKFCPNCGAKMKGGAE